MTTYARQDNWEIVGEGCAGLGCVLIRTVRCGVIAGVSFAIYETLIAWLLTGQPLEPLRMVAGISGASAAESWYPLSAALPIALAIHMVLSIVFALVFVSLLGYLPWAINTRAKVITAAAIYSLFLWFMNFYVFAPLFGWNWFIHLPHPFLQGLVGHFFFYGIVLGYFLQLGRRRYADE